MTKHETLDAVLAELRQYGIETTISHGSKHIQVRWFNRLNQPRFTTLSRVSSKERHAVQNARHGVRQILREDGMLPVAELQVPPPPRMRSKIEQLEHDLQALNFRILRVERLLKEHAS